MRETAAAFDAALGEVHGPSVDLVAWLSGRSDGARLDVPEPLPQLPAMG